MATTAPYPLPRERNLILLSLLALAAAAWALLAWQSAVTDSDDMSLTMGMGAPLFMAIWVAMMAAMMFPPAGPRRGCGRREARRSVDVVDGQRRPPRGRHPRPGRSVPAFAAEALLPF